MTHTEATWKADGQPVRYASPIFEIAGEIRRRQPRHTAALGTLGNAEHLAAKPPEDHTPFSATGWPIAATYPYVYALDWSGPGFSALGEFWLTCKRDSLAPWLKYINLGGRHYQFEPEEKVSKSDDGPTWVHLSTRSDYTKVSIASGWPTLNSGTTGPRVRQLQQLLNLNYGDTLAVDGRFGPKTLDEVKHFQDHALLTEDGIAGPLTRIALAVKLP